MCHTCARCCHSHSAIIAACACLQRAVGAVCRHHERGASAALLLARLLASCSCTALKWQNARQRRGIHALQLNGAGVQNMALRSNAQTFQNRTVYLKNRTKIGEKQKWHQRHNLTVLS